jgi:DnaA family protein
MINQQLPLGVTLQDNARFENYLPGPNAEIISQMRSIAEFDEAVQLYCWAPAGRGKTHLLQALCHSATQAGNSAIYIPLDQYASLHPSVLEDLEEVQIVCLDDLDRIAGKAAWEEALFHCYNAIKQGGGSLIVSAETAPAGLPVSLADLRSRLESGLIYNLQALDDAQRLQALQLRAKGRGFDLPEDTGQFLMRRVARDMTALFDLLDKLDAASLSAQRRLTIPFVKTIL